jgi:hypothetical protein
MTRGLKERATCRLPAILMTLAQRRLGDGSLA